MFTPGGLHAGLCHALVVGHGVVTASCDVEEGDVSTTEARLPL